MLYAVFFAIVPPNPMSDLHMEELVLRRIVVDPGQQIVGVAQYRVTIPYRFVGGNGLRTTAARFDR
jgi:hypothetical protein